VILVGNLVWKAEFSENNFKENFIYLKNVIRYRYIYIQPVVGLGLGGPEERLKRGPSDDVIILSQP